MTLGSRDQLAQVIHSLLASAERSLSGVHVPTGIQIASASLGRRAIVEIAWPSRPDSEPDYFDDDPSEHAGLSLEVCRGIVHTHGGELRMSQPEGGTRFEVDLPLVDVPRRKDNAGGSISNGVRRQLTVLVVEPEAVSQRHVVSAFTNLGHRVVPVASAEEGADLADRMRFDIAVCALRLTGLSWADFVERVRNAVAIIVLLTDGYDPSLARAFKSNEVFVLSKPANPAEIRNICANAESLEERSPVLR